MRVCDFEHESIFLFALNTIESFLYFFCRESRHLTEVSASLRWVDVAWEETGINPFDIKLNIGSQVLHLKHGFFTDCSIHLIKNACNCHAMDLYLDVIKLLDEIMEWNNICITGCCNYVF